MHPNEHMKNTASSVVYTGSYWMSAEPFAACLACIPKMKKLDTPKMFREMGTKLTDGFKAAGKEHGFDLVVSGEPALFYLRIANDDSLMLHQEWIAECVSRGLFLASHHNHFMNAAVTDVIKSKLMQILDLTNLSSVSQLQPKDHMGYPLHLEHSHHIHH